MDLVLEDIARWNAQLKGELGKIEEAIGSFDERAKEEKGRLVSAKETAEIKIKETGELLDKLGYEAPDEIDSDEEVEVLLAAGD